jgi:hypothetical protein
MAGNSTVSDRKALKARYLGCFAARGTGAQTLRDVVKDLLQAGVLRGTLFGWAVAAGYSPATVRSLLSRAFCALGLRQRKAGAGRKPSAEALELLAHSRQRYGNRALPVLRAAYRAGETPGSARRRTRERREGAAPATIVVPQLKGSALIDGPQLHAAGRTALPLNCRRARRQHRPLARWGTNHRVRNLLRLKTETK